MLNYSLGHDGIATLEFDYPNKSQNILNTASMTAFADAVKKALADPAVKGVLLASAKHDFIAGGDLAELAAQTDVRAIAEGISEWHTLGRTMETSGKPVAAALNGSALGGGFELALCCHYRVAANNPNAQFGFPEVTLGLLPGAGGTQRGGRLMGLQASVPLLVEGKRIKVQEAQTLGLIHAMVTPGEERAAAKAWLLGEGQHHPQQPWDSKGFKIPGCGVMTPAGMQFFTAANAMLRAKTYGNYPAPKHILSCLFEGLQTDIDTGLKIEARYFANLVASSEAKNMIRCLFFGMQRVKKRNGKGGERDENYPRRILAIYVAEGMALLEEGYAPALINHAGLLAGMSAGPLTLADAAQIARVARVKKSPTKLGADDLPEIIDRLILVQSVEAIRCLDEGLVPEPIDADVEAIRSAGYPAFRGGPIGWLHTLGLPNALVKLNALAATHGPRFAPPESLTLVTPAEAGVRW